MKYVSRVIFSILIFGLSFSCKNIGNDKALLVDGDPELLLEEMYVHFQKVENESVSISWPEINSFDIIAKFNYGRGKSEEIPVIVESSPVMLTKDETILLSCPAVAGKYKEWKGKVDIKKIKAIPQDKDVIDTFVVTGGRDKGVLLGASNEVYTEIMNGGYPTIEMKGDIFQFIIGHKKNMWDTAYLNGKEVSVSTQKELILWKSGYAGAYDISGFKSLVPVLLEAKFQGKKSYVHFKIKHIDGTCDIPDLELYVNDKKVSGMGKLEDMASGKWPVFDGSETTECHIVWYSDDVEECKINGDVQTIKTEKRGDEDIRFVEYSLTGCTSEGKEIVVELKSKRKELFHDVKWEFKIRKN